MLVNNVLFRDEKFMREMIHKSCFLGDLSLIIFDELASLKGLKPRFYAKVHQMY